MILQPEFSSLLLLSLAFVHYQATIKFNDEFYSKFLINHANTGSVVHYGIKLLQNSHRILYGLTYSRRLQYITSYQQISKWEGQTATLQYMCFEDAFVVSNDIKWYPTPTATNVYNRTIRARYWTYQVIGLCYYLIGACYDKDEYGLDTTDTDMLLCMLIWFMHAIFFKDICDKWILICYNKCLTFIFMESVFIYIT